MSREDKPKVWLQKPHGKSMILSVWKEQLNTNKDYGEYPLQEPLESPEYVK